MQQTGLPRVLRPFLLPRYRWLVAGLSLALFCDGVWIIAIVWQVMDLGGRAGAVSLVSGTAAVGMVTSSLAGGVLADRLPQRSIIICLEMVKLLAFGSVGIASVGGLLGYPHLVVAALAGGITTGMYYSAYSALLPRILAVDSLQAANGIEGFLRPVIFQAGGPMIAGAIIGAVSPGAAINVAALAALGAGLCYAGMGSVPDSGEPGSVVWANAQQAKPVIEDRQAQSVFADLGEGFRYMWRTPWLWASLFFACLLVLMTMGPIEVLVPFTLRDRADGTAADHALVLAGFGVGAALGAFVFASIPMPRRYLSTIFAFWSVCSVPLAVMAFATETWMFVAAAFLIGFCLDGPTVLWGTLLQSRVPTRMLGRVSALDFFVSASLAPVSMALAAPAYGALGATATFLAAALIPVPCAIVCYLVARLHADEKAHPLTVTEEVVELSAPPGPRV